MGEGTEVRPFSPRDAAELDLGPAGFRGSVPREAVAGEWGVGDYIRARGLAPRLRLHLCVCVVCMCRVAVRVGNLGEDSFHHVGPGDRT